MGKPANPIRWTWFAERDGECWDETFPTAEAALEAMAQRQGDKPDQRLVGKMAELGLLLAMVQVTVKPLMVLREHQK